MPNAKLSAHLAMLSTYLQRYRYRFISSSTFCTGLQFSSHDKLGKPYHRNGSRECWRSLSSSSSTIDSFAVLELSRTFSISQEELKIQYRKLMAINHPDRHAHLPPNELILLEETASKITHSYGVLRHPHTRATHLLELVGEPLDETSQHDLVGMEFLMEVMEIREAIDNASDASSLQRLASEANESIERLLEECEQSFHAKNYEQAKVLSSKLQYWNRIERSINEKIDPE